MGEINAIGPPLSSPGQVSCAGPALRRNGNIYIMIGRARGRAGPRLKMARTLSSSSAGGGLAGGHHGGQGRGHGARHQHLAPGGGLDTETRGLLLHTLLLRVVTGS